MKLKIDEAAWARTDAALAALRAELDPIFDLKKTDPVAHEAALASVRARAAVIRKERYALVDAAPGYRK